MKSKQRHPLHEAAIHCGLSAEIITRFITFEWITPADREQQILDEEDIARVRLICLLQQEFGVNDEAVPIILHLIDQLNRTHLELKDRQEK